MLISFLVLLVFCVFLAFIALSAGPEKPLTWLREVVKRKRALSNWEDKVSRGNLLENALDLSALFNPETFLNAVRQQVSE